MYIEIMTRSRPSSMKGSFTLLGWSCENDFTSSFIFSSEDSSLQVAIVSINLANLANPLN